MKLLKEIYFLTELDNSALVLKKLNFVAPHLSAGDLGTSPDTLSSFTGLPIETVKKALDWAERKGKGKQLKISPEQPLASDVHKIVALLYWLKAHPEKRSVEDYQNAIGLSIDEIQQLASKYQDDIRQIIPAFKPSWIPTKHTTWNTLSDSQRKAHIADAIEQVSGGKLGTVTAENVAKYLSHKGIDVDKRSVDRFLERSDMQQYDRYRVRGRYGKG